MMSEPVPVACTLTPADLAGQARRWQRLMTRALTGRAETRDGLRLSFRAEAEDELRALVAVEAGCCAWAAWTVEPTAGAVVLDVRSAAEGAEGAQGVTALQLMFGADTAHAAG
jgi:hypothetical protein